MATTSKAQQMFEVKWNYYPDSPPANPALDFTTVVTMTEYENRLISPNYINSLRSGIKGYKFGQPIISGYSADKQSIDITYKNRFNSYKQLNGKLCGTNSRLEREQLVFGQNITNNCIVQVHKSDLAQANCDIIKKVIFNKINDYFAPSNFVSKNGNPDMQKFDTNDWIDVFPNQRILNNTQDSNSNIFTVCKVPYRINVWFFYLTNGKLQGEPFYEIAGTYLT